MGTTASLLRLHGLVKRFDGLLVTDNVSLSIGCGEVHAVIGPNGAGKTTLINQVVGEIHSDAGRVELGGCDVTDWTVHARARAGLGRSYQITSIIPEFSVLENMLLAVQSLRGHCFHFWRPAHTDGALVEAAQQLLSAVGLLHVRHLSAASLAYGQQRQLELAMTLATKPKVLLLDEPMAGLGPSETQQMIGVLHGIRHHYAILLVEHDMAAVFALATACSVLVYGRIVFTGTPSEVKESDVVREAYLGDEEIDA